MVHHPSLTTPVADYLGEENPISEVLNFDAWQVHRTESGDVTLEGGDDY